MIPATAETAAAFLKAIATGPFAYVTLLVWFALGPYVRPESGEIRCTLRMLARSAGVSVRDVSRALERLVEIGVLLRDQRGRYRIHPCVDLQGEAARREPVRPPLPKLTLINGGKTE
jgi:hypothetical protein